MNKILINVKSVKVLDYNRNTNNYDLEINLDINGNERNIKRTYEPKNAEIIYKDLIEFIKNKFEEENTVFSDDPLEGNIILIDNVEDIEDKMIMFFKKLNDKVRGFKTMRVHEGFINMYHSFKGLSISF
ncbi:hypothetical protein K8R47_01240 [archaeon]|nr:hypothetical protein [archaeon]